MSINKRARRFSLLVAAMMIISGVLSMTACKNDSAAKQTGADQTVSASTAGSAAESTAGQSTAASAADQPGTKLETVKWGTSSLYFLPDVPLNREAHMSNQLISLTFAAAPAESPGSGDKLEVVVGAVAKSYPAQAEVSAYHVTRSVAAEGGLGLLVGINQVPSLREADPDVPLIDVRTPDEFNAGHLPAAVNIPLNELKEKIAESYPDKDRPLILYCRSGNRSAQGASQLLQMGYGLVLDAGGIIDWQGKTE